MDEWLAARLDVDSRTARTLLGLARSNDERIDELLEHGASVDRAAATLRPIQTGADRSTVDGSIGRDVAGVRRTVAQRRSITPDAESDGHAGRFLHMQPSLDETIWRLWGQLSGVDGRMGWFRWRRNGSRVRSGGHEATAEIFIDAALATASEGREGVGVVSGPRVGPNTLGEIFCSGTVRVTVHDDSLRTHLLFAHRPCHSARDSVVRVPPRRSPLGDRRVSVPIEAPTPPPHPVRGGREP